MESLLPVFIIPLFLVVFPLFWCGVVAVVGLISGWGRLAEHYRYNGTFQGQKWAMQSARMGLSSYNSSLTFGANWEGLYLSPMLIFRCGHPPLFIPWYDLSVKQTGALFTPVEFRFQRVPSVKVRLNKKLSERLAEVAGDAWPAESDSPADMG